MVSFVPFCSQIRNKPIRTVSILNYLKKISPHAFLYSKERTMHLKVSRFLAFFTVKGSITTVV